MKGKVKAPELITGRAATIIGRRGNMQFQWLLLKVTLILIMKKEHGGVGGDALVKSMRSDADPISEKFSGICKISRIIT